MSGEEAPLTPEEEREHLEWLQSMLKPEDKRELFVILVTIRWAFGFACAVHWWAVYSFCNGQLEVTE